MTEQIRTSCLPPPSIISKGFIRHIQALPAFSLSYDFDSIRALLIEYIQKNFPDWQDFLESTTGMLFVEMIAYTATMLAYRADFQRAQTYVDTVSDIDSLSELMLLVGEKLRTPSPTYQYQIDSITGLVNLRLTRRIANSSGEVQIYPGTTISIQTEAGLTNYEFFEIDDSFNIKYGDILSSPLVPFTVLNANAITSDPPTGSVYPLKPASTWIIVEGKTYIETFISNGSADQSFPLSHAPIITDYGNNNYRSAMTVQSDPNAFVDSEWLEVSSLVRSSSYNKHYELEWDGSFKGKIKFGNGVFGKIPAPGSIIKVAYRVGGGADKRVSSNRINLTINGLDATGTTSLTFTNLAPTIGGGTGDTLLRAKSQLPARIRAQQRLVSGEDYAQFASDFPGISKAKADLLNNDATGNLVRMRIMEYISTSEGYIRPYEGTNQTLLAGGYLSSALVEDITYSNTTQNTTINLLDSVIGFSSDVTMSSSTIYLISRLGQSKRFTIASDFRTLTVYNEDVTELFVIGSTVGLTILNNPDFMIKLPASASNAFKITGMPTTAISTMSWPGDSTQWAILQIDDEFIQVAASPNYVPTSGSTEVNSFDVDVNGTSTTSTVTGASVGGYHLLNVLSRGYYGTTVSPHVNDTRLYLGGIRPDLYRAMSVYKAGTSETLIMEGKIIPIYLMLNIKMQSSSNSALFDTIRLTLEQYLNFNNTLWGFSKPLRISHITTLLQNLAGVSSVTYTHATQYILNTTDSNKGNYTPTVLVDEDITGIPEDTVLGLLPYLEAISTVNNVIAADSESIRYYLGVDLVNSSTTITLSTSAGSDFTALPPAGIIKIKNEFIAYKFRSGNVLSELTRDVYSTAAVTSTSTGITLYPTYLAMTKTPIYLCPNILISMTSA
jgi:hypothetical protein